MARMKFICDAERCIECNGCATACKQEHEIPWGVNRRRLVTVNDGVPGGYWSPWSSPIHQPPKWKGIHTRPGGTRPVTMACTFNRAPDGVSTHTN